MGSAGRRQDASVEARLRREPHRFEFFQAVRVLEAIARDRALRDKRWERESVGHDAAPHREVVRFQALPSLSFPPGEIAELSQPRPKDVEEEWRLPPPEMLVSFLGLTGPLATLPSHYTETVITRMRSRDHALRRFLDLFNHRSISLFYRAWAKYRIGCGYEAASGGARGGESRYGDGDLLTWCLYSLVGLGTEHLRGRLRVADEAFLFYGGHFAAGRANASSLERMLAEYFEIPTEIEQFQGEWLYLRREDRTVLPSEANPLGQHNRLGQDTILGQQAWDIRGRFRVRMGPLTHEQYRGLMPGGDALATVADLTRTYVGNDLAFDVMPVLRADEVPECALDSLAEDPLRLGGNVWLRSAPCEDDFAGVAFEPDAPWGTSG